MSRPASRPNPALGDEIALSVQQLRSRDPSRGDPPLVRIDHRDEAARAPYQFDGVRGRLHRRGCRAIPDSSRTALYGVWQMTSEEAKLVCPECKPAPEEAAHADDHFTTDLLYGLLSVIDQFGGVLRERGRGYRRSKRGRHLEVDLEGLYRSLGKREHQTLEGVASALDGILRKIRDLDQNLGGRNGNDRGRNEP